MISSIHNKRVAKAVRLKKRAMREKDRRFLVEGLQAVTEALAAPGSVQELFYVPTAERRVEPVVGTATGAGVRVHPVSPDVMAHLTSTVTPQGVVAVSVFVDVALDDAAQEGGCVPVLVEVRDPGNAGTILRSADASGAGAVVFTRSSVDVYNPKAVRASAGSLFHVPVVREIDAEQAVKALRHRGYAILAADASGPTSVYDVDLTGSTAVLFGNEARGLPRAALDLADGTVRVPIRGKAESLNLAAAATLVVFEAARQRAAGQSDLLAAIVAGAAHDLRSPLTALRGFASTVVSKWDRLGEDQKLMMLEGVVHDAARMEVIMAQLVDASRVRSKRLRLAPVPTNLLDVARDAAGELRGWSAIEVEVTGESAVAMADRARLRTMLLALIEGAQWYGDRGQVMVQTSAGRMPTVLVYRQGSTIEEGEAEGVFRPRPPGTSGGGKLGLFVARALAEAHGGALSIEVGDRCCFILRLPAP